MIEVIVPSARFNTHRQQYNRLGNRTEMIKLKIDRDGLSTEIGLTVEEAEMLANSLNEWIKDIKEE